VATFSVHSLAEFCAGKFALRGNVRAVNRYAPADCSEFFEIGGKRADVFTARASWPGQNPDEDEITRAGGLS
jgi:hypothetical protein